MAAQHLVWEGPVGHATINERATLRKRRRGYEVGASDKYKGAMREMELVFRSQWPGGPFIGPVTVHIRTCWPKTHRQGVADGMPFGDVDACVKATLDALAKAGVYEDDAQVARLVAVKDHARGRPRIEVSVEQWEGDPSPDPHGGMAQAGGR